jgi:hypothetical protein
MTRQYEAVPRHGDRGRRQPAFYEFDALRRGERQRRPSLLTTRIRGEEKMRPRLAHCRRRIRRVPSGGPGRSGPRDSRHDQFVTPVYDPWLDATGCRDEWVVVVVPPPCPMAVHVVPAFVVHPSGHAGKRRTAIFLPGAIPRTVRVGNTPARRFRQYARCVRDGRAPSTPFGCLCVRVDGGEDDAVQPPPVAIPIGASRGW